MREQPPAGDDANLTGVFGATKARQLRWLLKARAFIEKWLPHILGGALSCAALYIVHLRESVVQVRERVVVLETEVVPVINESKTESTNSADIEDLKGRVTRIEDNYDFARTHAGDAPTRRRK
jgi:hypothetical protein